MSERAVEVHFPSPAGPVDVLVIAGEHSGDEQAARMVGELLERQPRLRIAALGGRQLETVGAQLLYDLTATSVVGLFEVLRHYGLFRRIFAETLRWIREHRPRVVCFVDYPGFNLRMARALKAAGLSRKGGGAIRAVYYISPQIWAWKSRRRFEMAQTLDELAVIFPFEVKSYADTTLPVRFVGHPFATPDFVLPLVYSSRAPVLLLPGSREAAVKRIAPVLLDGFSAFLRNRPDARATMIYPSELVRVVLEAELSARPELGQAVALQPNRAPATGSAVLTSSGTMSLQCALAAIPGAIAYRINPLTYVAAQRLVKVRYIGIANLMLPEPIYPEFIQGSATREVLAAELVDCVENPARLEHTRKCAQELRHLLSQPPRGDAAAWLAEQIVAS